MLREEQLAAALVALPGWQQGDRCILKVYDFADFPSAMRFVHRVADLAEARNHHPDIRIHSWNHLELRCWTHTVGGLSQNDFVLARRIDRELGA